MSNLIISGGGDEHQVINDIGKIVNGTLLTNTVSSNGYTKMYSLALTPGVWLCVFTYRCDSDTGASYPGFNTTFVGTSAAGASATAVEVKIITTNTTVYGTIYRSPSASTYTFNTGGRNCFAIKIK